LSRYPNVQDLRPDDTDWTGAEIRTCCDTADRLSITPKEAAQYIIPVAKQAPETLQALRQQATGRYISASTGGPYQPPVKPQPQSSGRKMEL
jgi:hypothetical protein